LCEFLQLYLQLLPNTILTGKDHFKLNVINKRNSDFWAQPYPHEAI